MIKMRLLPDGSETDEEKKTSLEKMAATELLKLALETDEERKARLKKMVTTTQLRLAPETEDERRARLEYLSDNLIYIPNNLYLILEKWFPLQGERGHSSYFRCFQKQNREEGETE